MIEKIATAAVYVENQRQAVEFWTKQVGFTVHRENRMTPDTGWIEVGPEGAGSCLVLYPKSLMKGWAERKPSIVFECENVRTAFEAMRERGVHFSQEPTAMPWGLLAIFDDGDGNRFGLRQAGKKG